MRKAIYNDELGEIKKLYKNGYDINQYEPDCFLNWEYFGGGYFTYRYFGEGGFGEEGNINNLYTVI